VTSVRQARRSRGFTLIEMMIVILIIGLLMAIILPNLTKSKYQTQWSACVQYERNLAAALESYNAQEKTYPPTLSYLTTGHPVFINAVPKCPTLSGPSDPTYDYAPGYSTTDAQANGRYDVFTITCPGSHDVFLPHVTHGYPQYSPTIGIRQKNAIE